MRLPNLYEAGLAVLYAVVVIGGSVIILEFKAKLDYYGERINNIENSGIWDGAHKPVNLGSEYCHLNWLGNVQRSYVMCPKEEHREEKSE